jgi:hypothetical protein
MNVSLLVLALWLSDQSPLDSKYPAPVPVQDPAPKAKPPTVTKPAKLLWKPGSYAIASLKLPETIKMEQFEVWQQGPAWPQLEHGVVVVTDHAGDPNRFLAFLVDVKAQKIAAVRDGDKGKHFLMIGQMQSVENNKDPQGGVPTSIMTLAGSGAVIIIRPPQPPGPNGLPDDLVAKILDAGTIAGQAAEWVTNGKAGLG